MIAYFDATGIVRSIAVSVSVCPLSYIQKPTLYLVELSVHISCAAVALSCSDNSAIPCPLTRWVNVVNHTHTRLTAGPFSGTTQVSRYQKVKPFWILLKQETVSGSGISWAICESAPCCRQITTPAPHHFILQAGCPSCRPTNSVKALKATNVVNQSIVNFESDPSNKITSTLQVCTV